MTIDEKVSMEHGQKGRVDETKANLIKPPLQFVRFRASSVHSFLYTFAGLFSVVTIQRVDISHHQNSLVVLIVVVIVV